MLHFSLIILTVRNRGNICQVMFNILIPKHCVCWWEKLDLCSPELILSLLLQFSLTLVYQKPWQHSVLRLCRKVPTSFPSPRQPRCFSLKSCLYPAGWQKGFRVSSLGISVKENFCFSASNYLQKLIIVLEYERSSAPRKKNSQGSCWNLMVSEFNFAEPWFD